MGKTYRNPSSRFDDEQRSKKGKQHNHANNRKSHGMRILNDGYDSEDFYASGDEYYDDEVVIRDDRVINRRREY